MKSFLRCFRTSRSGALLSIAFLATTSCGKSLQHEPVASPWLEATATLGYWTPERMAAAAQIPGGSSAQPAEPPITPGGDDIGYALAPPPYRRAETSRTSGILFFHDPSTNQDAHCTASVLASPSRRLIVTSAHCLVSFSGLPSLVWLQYPLFVPAYDGSRPLDDGERTPFGLWPVSRIYVPGIASQNPAYLLRAEYDLAVAGTFDQLGRPIGDVLQGGFAPRVLEGPELPGPFPLLKTIGYVACSGELCQGQVAYPGDRQYGCESAAERGSSALSIRLPNCGLGSGNSGGPVFAMDEAARTTMVAVIHSPIDQTPLLPDTFPLMEQMAEDDHARRASPGKTTDHAR